MAMVQKMFCHYCGTRLAEKRLDGRSRLYCGGCRRVIYENPVPASCLVVVDPSDRVLLVKRNMEPQKGFWCLPGGFMELGETPEQAALRELKEETGLSGQIEILLGINSNYSLEYDTVLMVGYLVKNYTGILKPGDDAADAAFFPLEELPDIAFSSHLKFIRITHAVYSY